MTSGVFIVNFDPISPFSSLSVVVLKQVNICCEATTDFSSVIGLLHSNDRYSKILTQREKC